MSMNLWARGQFMSATLRVAAAAAVMGLASCGGGGGASPAPTASLAQRCAPTNPYKADASAPTTVGTLADEKAWLHGYMDQAYLWYSGMPTVDATASTYSDTTNVYRSLYYYFQDLKTPALTASGKRRDQFSFIYPTKPWNDLAQSGQSYEYGIYWLTADAAPWNARVAYVEAGSPAAAAGVQRGDVLVSVDGVAVNGLATPNDLYARLYPSDRNSHQLAFNTRSVSLAGATVTQHPVPLTQVFPVGNKKVGYILFNAHMGTAEADLITAFTTLQAQGANELVLDMRYNGGGYLYVASELAYMVAGASAKGKVFEQLQYNDKRAADTAAGIELFRSQPCKLVGNQCTGGADLPTLSLSRVTVLTSADTCSASEAVVNGLRGVDVDVRLIGGTTCGKPYGFTAKDNCGISYFPIEFQGVNAKGFGDYADGFTATCTAADDLGHPLGDAAEGQLAAALSQLSTGNCPTSNGRAQPQSVGATRMAAARLLRGPERESRILLPTEH